MKTSCPKIRQSFVLVRRLPARMRSKVDLPAGYKQRSQYLCYTAPYGIPAARGSTKPRLTSVGTDQETSRSLLELKVNVLEDSLISTSKSVVKLLAVDAEEAFLAFFVLLYGAHDCL